MGQLITSTLPPEAFLCSRVDRKNGCSYACFNNGKMLISESGKKPKTIDMTEQQREDLRKELERLERETESVKRDVKGFEEELDRYRTY